MASQFQNRSLHDFSMKKLPSSSSSSTMTTVKLKTLIHTLIFSHVCRMARAISRAKSILVELLEKHRHSIHEKNNKYTKKKKKKVFFGSFRLHYNWCSNSHFLPVPPPGLDRHLYSDSSIWNNSSIITALESESGSASLSSRALSGYLEWLEEKNCSGSNVNEAAAAGDVNEIDRLADAFIANCHEKFRLEKQESYRRHQEMLARSM